MERPAWTFIVLSSILPRDLSDIVTITVLELASLQILTRQVHLGNISLDTLPLLILVPGISLLSSFSHDSNKEKRELALLAYGSSKWHIWSRYFLRGTVLTFLGILPILVLGLLTANFLLTIILVSLLVIGAGALYCLPSLRRVSSLEFVGRYKR